MPTDSPKKLGSVADSLNTRAVKMALESKIPVNELSPEQQQAHAQMLWQLLEYLDGSDVRALQEIKRAGGSVYGLDRQSNIKKAGPL